MAEFSQAGWTTDAMRPIEGKTKVLFSVGTKRMNYQSEKEEREVFKEFEMITLVPADQYLVVTRPIREKDKQEYASEYEHWKRTRENRVLGMPIDMWPVLSASQKAEFKAMKIETIEQFAALPDIAGQRIMGFNDLRKKAQVFCNAGHDSEVVGQIRAEAAATQEALQGQIDKLTAMVEAMTAPSKEKAK